MTEMLGRLIAVCFLVAVNDLILPSGALKTSVRLISGLVLADLVLHLVLALPAAVGF